jgi:hypothetical protein
MPEAIVAIIFGSFLILMKMILSHKGQNQLAQTVSEANSMALSELQEIIDDAINQRVEPLMARIDELESAQLLGTSERMLLGESEPTPAKKELPSRPNTPAQD